MSRCSARAGVAAIRGAQPRQVRQSIAALTGDPRQIPHRHARAAGRALDSALGGMALEAGPGQTVLTGEVRGRAHLYGLLDRLRDFGIELVAVEPADPADADVGHGWQQTPGHLSMRAMKDPQGDHGGGRRSGLTWS